MKVKRMVTGAIPAALAIAIIPLGAPAQAAWDGAAHGAATSWGGTAWDGTAWSGKTWDAPTWDDKTWDGKTWDGKAPDVGGWTGYRETSYTWTGYKGKDYPWGDFPWSGRWDGYNWDGYQWATPDLYAKPGRSLYLKYLSAGGPLEARWVSCGPWGPGPWSPADWAGKVGKAIEIRYTGDGSAYTLGSGFKGGSCVRVAIRSLDGAGTGPYPIEAYFG
jgi:hypothetical protein